MTTKGSQDRMLDALYAGLDQTERARLLARWARAGDARELDRLRRTIPDAAAETAFNRAIRILRQLHGPMVPMLVATGTAIERDTVLLLLVAQQMAQRRQARVILRRLWAMLGYPLTVGECRLLVAADRSEPRRLATLDSAADSHYPTAPTLLQRVPHDDEREDWEDWESERAAMIDDADPEDDIPHAEARFGRIRPVPTIARGDLPTRKRTQQGITLPRGVLTDSEEGTTPNGSEPGSPTVHVPVLALVGGEGAAWDVRPDTEQDDVVARREALLAIASDIMTALGGLGAAGVAGLTLEPVTGAERDQMAEQVRHLWPWDHDRDRHRLQELVRAHARHWAEAQAYRAVIATLQATEFGGEDPLDPMVRALLLSLEATEAEFTDLWSVTVAALAPSFRDEADPWSLSLEDAAYLEQVRTALEAHLRGEWDA
jgi:hypothetical protein